MLYNRLLLVVTCLALSASVAASQDVRKDIADQYMVVINHEEQYSIWPRQKADKLEGKVVVESCLLEACHKYIEEVWTDMRPLNLRKKMADKKIDPDKSRFFVVINHEEQYLIVMDEGEIPRGWKPVGKAASLSACQDHIKKVWTDMRPLSMREK